MNVWRKVQQLHEAMRHIFDNDTSGFPGQFGMTVRYRCGQCNELLPVCVFLKKQREVLSADESRERVSWLSWADKMLLICRV